MPGISPIFITPLFTRWSTKTPIPPPPYAVFSSDGINVLTTIMGLVYSQGNGPSPDSITFSLLGLGLSPSSGNITITPNSSFTTSFEIYNPNTSAYTSSTFTIAYTGGSENLSGFKIRLKSGQSISNYSGTLTITAPNTLPFVLNVSGQVNASAFIVATGGTITVDGNFKVHSFNGNGTFTVVSAGDPINSFVDALVVGGGAGAGVHSGGGSGGYRYITSHGISVNSYPIAIGVGGSGVTTVTGAPTNGSNSSFDSIVAAGGGAAGQLGDPPLPNGQDGGSGGAAVTNLTGNVVGTAGSGNIPSVSPSQGNNGGVAAVDPSNGKAPGGGGGGAGTIGQDATVDAVHGIYIGGNGGDGLLNSITGTPTYYAGGGAGGANAGDTAGTGGLGGGGNGSSSTTPADNGITNTGGGGGGAGTAPFLSGNGGSGVVIIRYKFQ